MKQSDFIVCRCEEVTLQQLEQAYAAGAKSARELKMNTRASMGACQGRVCRRLVETWLENKQPGTPHDVELLSYRQPIRSITFGSLAEEE